MSVCRSLASSMGRIELRRVEIRAGSRLHIAPNTFSSRSRKDTRCSCVVMIATMSQNRPHTLNITNMHSNSVITQTPLKMPEATTCFTHVSKLIKKNKFNLSNNHKRKLETLYLEKHTYPNAVVLLFFSNEGIFLFSVLLMSYHLIIWNQREHILIVVGLAHPLTHLWICISLKKKNQQ